MFIVLRRLVRAWEVFDLGTAISKPLLILENISVVL
jgi:hypothetical protein